MRKLLLITIIVSTSLNVFADKNANLAKSVDIQNYTDKNITIWTNGAKQNISIDAAIFIPCLPNEKVEVQFEEMIKNIECGSILEIKQ